jgi:hypothetical protein
VLKLNTALALFAFFAFWQFQSANLHLDFHQSAESAESAGA